MSYKDGWAAINLEMPRRIPRTEYSAGMHWKLIKAVTGIDVGVDSPQPADTEPEFVADDTVIFAETGGADTPEDSVPWDLKIPEDTNLRCAGEAGVGGGFDYVGYEACVNEAQ